MKSIKKKLKICMYTPTADGGHARYTFELLTSIMKQREDQEIDAELVTSVNISKNYISDKYKINNILPILKDKFCFNNKIEWVLSRVIYYLKREILFFKWIKKRKDFNIIHFQEYAHFLGVIFFRLFKKNGFKIIYTVHNIYDHKYPFKWLQPFIDYSNKISWKLCDALIVHSESLKKQLRVFLGKGTPPIYVIPHPVWTINRKIEIIRDPSSKMINKTLIFFGVIRPNKGLHYLLEAMLLIKNYKLIIAGSFQDIEYQAKIKNMIKDQEKNIILIDRYISSDEMIELFVNSSAAILPYESFYAQSGVLHDAISLETPVVVTNVGALGEYVKKYDIGQVVDPGDARQLAKAIVSLHNKDRYFKVINNIRNLKNLFSSDLTGLKTIRLYKNILI